MDDGLKQRIVGAIVLVAIAMIFLPMLFDDNGSNNQEESRQIPEPPKAPDLAAMDHDTVAEKIPTVETADQHQQKTWQAQDNTTSNFDEEEPPAAVAEPISDAAQKPVVNTTVTPAPLPDAVKIDENGLPESWTLQVGMFGDKTNAQALSEKLVKKGYQSYVREIKDANGSSTFKVFVGPDVQKARLQETMKKLLTIKQELHISGVLLKPYQP